jgi:hypothetical protein
VVLVEQFADPYQILGLDGDLFEVARGHCVDDVRFCAGSQS